MPVHGITFNLRMRRAASLIWMVFISPHQSEKFKPLGPDYYLPPLLRVLSTPHPIRLSSQTVAESLYYFSEVSFWIRLFNLGTV